MTLQVKKNKGIFATPSLSRTLLFNLIVISVISILVLGILWIYYEYTSFLSLSQNVKEAYYDDKKNLLKLEVETSVDYIEYKMAQTEERLRSSIKNRVYDAHAIALNLYDKYHDHIPLDQLKGIVKEALRSISFNSGRGYYFATDLNGVEQLFADHPELEGKSMLGLKGGTGEYVVRDMIQLVKDKDEGFYSYYWTKPGAEGNDHSKIAFVKYFEPFGWFFGTGEYWEDVVLEIQQEALARIERIKFGDQGYVFAGSWDGISLSGPAKGRNMLDVTDTNGVKVVRELIALSKGDGGYLSYVMPRFSGQKSALKMSYVVGIPEWRWYVGSGIYVDEVDAVIAQQRERTWQKIKSSIIKIVMILAGLILLSVFIHSRMAFKTRSQFRKFIESLGQATESSAPIDETKMPWQEFKRLAFSTNRILSSRDEVRKSLVESEGKYRSLFELSNDAIFEVEIGTGRYLNANDAGLRLTGRSLADLRQLTTHDVVPINAKERLKKLSGSTGPLDMGEVIYVRPDGTERIAELTTMPVSARSVFGIARDITERKHMENVLREERDNAQKYLDIAEVMFLVINRDQRVSLINKKGCAVLGFKEDAIVGKNWFDTFIPEHERDEIKKVFAELVKENIEPVEYFENSVLTADNKTRLIAWHNALIRDENGAVTATLSSGVDITESNRIEEAIRESEKRFRDLADSLPQTVFETDESGALVFVNKAAYVFFGYRQEDFTRGFQAIDMISAEDRSRALQDMQRVMSGRMQRPNEYMGLKKDGGTFPIMVHASPIVREGKTVGLRGIIVDQSEQRKLESRLQQAQKMEAIGTLAGGIAHDFNNILSAVIGYAELSLGDVARGSQLERSLKEILRAGTRAKDLVKQILTFARKVDEDLKPVRVSTIAKEVLKLLRSTLPTSIQIKSRIKSESLVLADLTRIHQIFMNLCTNAAQAMEKDGGVLDVRLTDTEWPEDDVSSAIDLQPGKYLLITIADTGYGISEQDLPLIFEPYFTTKPVGEGTGLGLSVVHGIVKGYNGEILVKSTPGQGTVFSIYLPVIKDREGKAVRTPEGLPRGTERILFVDDEAPVIEVGRRILERLGYHVTAYTSSLDALEFFRTNHGNFDLVISDMTMPNMTGDRLAVELMQIRPDIPIVLCTGYSKIMSEQTAAEIGVKAFAIKPLSAKDLATTIRRVLDGEG